MERVLREYRPCGEVSALAGSWGEQKREWEGRKGEGECVLNSKVSTQFLDCIVSRCEARAVHRPCKERGPSWAPLPYTEQRSHRCLRAGWGSSTEKEKIWIPLYGEKPLRGRQPCPQGSLWGTV